MFLILLIILTLGFVNLMAKSSPKQDGDTTSFRKKTKELKEKIYEWIEK